MKLEVPAKRYPKLAQVTLSIPDNVVMLAHVHKMETQWQGSTKIALQPYEFSKESISSVSP